MAKIFKKIARKFARQNYTGLQSQLNISFIQFVSPLPLICLYILLGLMFVCGCGCGILFQVGFWGGTWI